MLMINTEYQITEFYHFIAFSKILKIIIQKIENVK